MGRHFRHWESCHQRDKRRNSHSKGSEDDEPDTFHPAESLNSIVEDNETIVKGAVARVWLHRGRQKQLPPDGPRLLSSSELLRQFRIPHGAESSHALVLNDSRFRLALVT